MGPLFLSLLSALEIFILEMYVMLQHILSPIYPNLRVSPISTLSKRVLQIIDLKDLWFASLLLCIICCAYYCYFWDLCCMEIHHGLWNYSSSVLFSLTPPTFLRSISHEHFLLFQQSSPQCELFVFGWAMFLNLQDIVKLGISLLP